MNIARFISWFAFCGLLVPLSFQVIWWFVDRYQTYNISLQLGIQKVMMVLWPSSLMMLPPESDEKFFYVAIAISTIINIILYTSIGLAVWFGIKKSYAILVLTGIAILALSWRMLTF